MLAIKGAWSGQAFALASNNDEGGKKSRIRRSKQERKAMVESFINKYQKLNDGNFPSLNLTHKEVGGSFYTVREIVREIIQENRVLAPPKVSLDEHGHFKFLQQNPLGSISVEPENDLSVSEKLHIVAPQITTQELVSGSGLQFNGCNPLESNNEQIVNGLNKTPEKAEGSNGANISHIVPNQYQDINMEELLEENELETEKIVNGIEVLEENVDSDKPLITNGVPIYHQDNKDEKAQTEEPRQHIYKELVGNGNLDRERDGAKDVEVSQATTFHMNSDFVVEKFPLRPVSKTIIELDGQPGKLNETAVIHHGQSVEETINNHDKMAFVESHSDLVNEKHKEQLQESSFDAADVKDIKYKAITEATEGLISEDSTAVGTKSSPQYKNSLPKGNNPMLDRINLETWEGASSKRPQKNPILTLVKTFISAFVKFWTE